jgi:hypothetical protein
VRRQQQIHSIDHGCVRFDALVNMAAQENSVKEWPILLGIVQELSKGRQ